MFSTCTTHSFLCFCICYYYCRSYASFFFPPARLYCMSKSRLAELNLQRAKQKLALLAVWKECVILITAAVTTLRSNKNTDILSHQFNTIITFINVSLLLAWVCNETSRTVNSFFFVFFLPFCHSPRWRSVFGQTDVHCQPAYSGTYVRS